MDIHYLKLFNTLATQLNFSKTASLLFISQPAVSMQLKKLQQDLGVKLFDKIGKNICLNENGKILYEYTQRIFSLIEEAENHLYSNSDVIRGTVHIGSSNTPAAYIIPRLLGEYMEAYPDVRTHLHVGNTDEIEHMILDNKVDFAINGGNISYGSHVESERIAADRMVIITSPFHPLASSSAVEAQTLAQERFISHQPSSQLFLFVQSILGELGIPPSTSLHLGSIDAIKQAVMANLGIAVVPYMAVRMELKLKLFRELIIEGKNWEYPYHLIFRKNRFQSIAALKLIELLKPGFKRIIDEPWQ